MKNIAFILFILITGCNQKTQETTQSETNMQTVAVKKKKQIKITLESNKPEKIRIGDLITINYQTSESKLPDSIKLSNNFKPIKTIKPDFESIEWDTKNALPGLNDIGLTFYWGDSLNASKNLKFILLSDIVPQEFSYKIIKSFDHNHRSYTQGLEYNNGFIYEGTGQYGESMLFKIDIDKNEVIHSLNLPNDVFGEGITILDDKIYQLTWRSSTGFVYNKETFENLYEFSYPTEGWGLTNNGKELIMSDGSENIYFLDTEFMQETKKLQVYDNNGPVTNLNELEVIDDLIYANVYGTDEIVAFHIKTGKVLKRINLQGILNKKDVKNPIDVLNGIAWDKKNKRLIVTGKWWPKMFEIELIKK